MRVTRLLYNTIMKRIGTHDGCFHCDEALGCFMLKQLPEYRDAEIVRTRDEALLAKCDIVLDVGAKFDPATHRYDHHQRDFKHTMRTLTGLPFDTKLSSAGLIYVHFGKRVLAELVDFADGDPCNSPKMDMIYEKMYANFIEEIDGIDNGITPYEGKPRYKMTTHLSNRVADLLPWWNEKVESNMKDLFHKAMHMTGNEFRRQAKYFHDAWLPAREVVEEAIKNRFKTHESGQIIEKCGVPWKHHLFMLERELKVEKEILFILMEDDNKMWRVRAVPLDENEPFANRLPLPESWRGRRDAELVECCGIADARFVHASGFLGGCETKEGAIQMAWKTIQLQHKEQQKQQQEKNGAV